MPGLIDRRALLGGLATVTCAASGVAAKRRDLAQEERPRVLAAADRYLADQTRTIVAVPAARSPAGPHDYYSEADYWWPDSTHPGGPYVRRDGFSNPAKFDGHRDALIAFGIRMPALAAAWRITGRPVYSRRAAAHLHAWFVDPSTRMNPNLSHAQAIIGRDRGRAIGIIDTLQIVEVARAAQVMAHGDAPGYREIAAGVTEWFGAYLSWLTASAAGREERDQRNNHGTCWLLQAAAFAGLVGDHAASVELRRRLVDVLLPTQVAPDGRQPLELARTKPYSYSLFNMDVLAGACLLLGDGTEALWRARGPVGGSIADAIGFMVPFIRDKARWPFPPDVEHYGALPVRQPGLLFGGLALGRADWIALWRTLPADPTDPEIVRNFPIRQPVLWEGARSFD